MQTYFSGTLYKRNMIRFWPLAALCFLAAMLIFVLPEAASRRDPFVMTDIFASTIYEEKNIMSSLDLYVSLIAFPMSILTAIAVFGYLHNTKAAGFVSSLPVSRSGLYVTNWLSALTLMLAPLLVVGTIYGILLIGQPVSQGAFLQWIGAILASHFIYLSIAVFCTFLTGNAIVQAFIYGLFNFICYALYLVGVMIMSMLVFGYSGQLDSPGRPFVNWLTPPVALSNMINSMIPSSATPLYNYSGYETANPVVPWTLYLVFAALMILFGYLLYRRRHIESAGDILIHKPVKSILKYLIGLFAGVLMGIVVTFLIIPNDNFYGRSSSFLVWLTLSISFFGALGCLFTEMLIQKRLHVWKSAYKGIIGFVVAIAAIVTFIRLDGSGFERRVPSPRDVVSVSFTRQPLYHSNTLVLHSMEKRYVRTFGDNWMLTFEYREHQRKNKLPLFDDDILNEIKLRTPEFFESPDAIANAIELHQTLVDNKQTLRDAQSNWRMNSYSHYLIYTMKDGSTMIREYAFPLIESPVDELIPLMIELNNQSEAVNKRNRFASLPDESVTGLLITPVTDGDIWLVTTNYLTRFWHDSRGEPVISEDDITALTTALKKDAADGTLGLISEAEILLPYYIDNYGSNLPLFVIDLVLDFKTAGVPSAFEEDIISDENGFTKTSGLIQSITINETHVNTVQVLKELGFSE
ncbi:MAG: ABC transporter permease [Oscillospiraceae bacterium]|nr:ABC transporter permease [Oscillospiraceae bacterium]